MTILTTIVESAVGWVVGLVADKAASAFVRKWGERQAQDELINIIVEAIDAGIACAPNLGEDFRSDTFVREVVAPAVIQLLCNSNPKDPEAVIIEGYIEKFVYPARRGRTEDQTLTQLFRTSRGDLERGVSALLSQLRRALYSSNHWQESIRDQTLEAVYCTLIEMSRQPTISATDVMDVELARADAKEASKALQNWPQTILGEHIDREELAVLQRRILEQPYGCTLVIGESGSGKSALFAALIGRLQSQGVEVFAIKADLLPTDVKTLSDVSVALGLRGNILSEIEALAQTAPVVVLIDQLDAVSEVMDRSSDRMRLLLQIAHHFQAKKREERVAPPVHTLVSSRPFEADYDARFQSLKAEIVSLALPSLKQALELLTRLNVSLEEVPEVLHETLRRPFALRLFVDVFRRGFAGDDLIASQLLSTWLTSADLGDHSMRREVLSFLERLAGEMTESESLWRPVDVYEIHNPQAVQKAVAAGVVVRQNGLVGFSHQAWLDDFQAKGFPNAASLTNYAWQRQDGLFARATVLRALQRLRKFDVRAYEQSIDSLLGSKVTRRHLRHLVVDLIAGQQQPSVRERCWIQQLVQSDVPLARRALARITRHWGNWRGHLLQLVPSAMGNRDLRSSVIELLAAEALTDSDFVIRSIETYWGSSDHDLAALEVFSTAGQYAPAVVDRLRLIFARQRLDGRLIVSYVERVGDDRAAQLFGLFLKCVQVNDEERLSFYGLGKVAMRSAQAFSSVLFPWFVDLAKNELPKPRGFLAAYPASPIVRRWSDCEAVEEGLVEVLKSVFLSFAKEQPRDFFRFINTYANVEVEEVQSLILEGFAASTVSLANEALEYILGDSRRLQVGRVILEDAEDVSHNVDGWSTQVLLRALVPQLDADQLERLRQYIEAWDPYLHEAREEPDATTRRELYRCAEGKRLQLLALLPAHVQDARRYRQVQEWQTKQPDFRENRDQLVASVVGSRMSAKQMSSASDEDVFRMLEEVGDDTERWIGRRGVRRGGGTNQLAKAFAEFGKNHPSRAFSIAEQRFCPGKHENAAGELLRTLAEDPAFEAQRVRDLVWKWHLDGFATEVWRKDVAWALRRLAERNYELTDEDISLLESWIVNEPLRTEKRITSRIELERRNREANSHLKSELAPIVFRRGLGGMRVLPQGNFSLLSAMAAGLLVRPEPAWDGWLSALERHVPRSEDPAIWTALLIFYGAPLLSADRPRAMRLIQAIWDRYPDAFLDQNIGEFLWRSRDLVSQNMLQALRDQWLAGKDDGNRQVAGELLMAAVLVDPTDELVAEQLNQILAGPDTPERLGALFTASTAWNESSPGLRSGAHKFLLRFAVTAEGHDASAIASAMRHRVLPFADEYTRELLTAISKNPEVLRVCLKRGFAHYLQELLVSPGFEELVLEVSERCAQIMFAGGEPWLSMSYGESFVSIAIAIQRSHDPLRSRAMDLYERLLDGAVYGAEKAAAESLSRG